MTPRWRGAGAVLAAMLLLTGSACTSERSTGATSSPSASKTAASAAPTSGSSSDAHALQSQYTQTNKAVRHSVVLIRTHKDLGSGVVFDNKGDIVTNKHVVGTAKSFRVNRYGSAKSIPAKLVGSYGPDDLAVIRVSKSTGLKPATFADSGKVTVGDIVLAEGNPLGLTSSVTEGIVSAVGRTVSEPSGHGSPGATLPDTLQTSASINPGNSGGALVNLKHQVIGIPTLAASEQHGGGTAPGIGFAISSNVAKDIAGQLVKHGTVVHSHRAALEARVTTVSGSNNKPAGVGIVGVTKGGGAQKAGLKTGDVIVKVGGHATPTEQNLSQILANLNPGHKVKVTVERGGEHKTVTVKLGSLPG